MSDSSAFRSAYDGLFKIFMQAVERDLVPDFLIRRGIRYLLSQRVEDVSDCINIPVLNFQISDVSYNCKDQTMCCS